MLQNYEANCCDARVNTGFQLRSLSILILPTDYSISKPTNPEQYDKNAKICSKVPFFTLYHELDDRQTKGDQSTDPEAQFQLNGQVTGPPYLEFARPPAPPCPY